MLDLLLLLLLFLAVPLVVFAVQLVGSALDVALQRTEYTEFRDRYQRYQTRTRSAVEV